MLWLWGKALSPFAALVLLMVIRPFTERLRDRMKEGKLKGFLFFTWH